MQQCVIPLHFAKQYGFLTTMIPIGCSGERSSYLNQICARIKPNDNDRVVKQPVKTRVLSDCYLWYADLILEPISEGWPKLENVNLAVVCHRLWTSWRNLKICLNFFVEQFLWCRCANACVFKLNETAVNLPVLSDSQIIRTENLFVIRFNCKQWNWARHFTAAEVQYFRPGWIAYTWRNSCCDRTYLY